MSVNLQLFLTCRYFNFIYLVKYTVSLQPLMTYTSIDNLNELNFLINNDSFIYHSPSCIFYHLNTENASDIQA